MHIYVDESGLFIPALNAEAWCVVAAFMLPENDVRKLKLIITRLKVKSGKTYRDEIKLREVNEEDYFKFLSELNKLNGSLYCTASNMAETTQDELSTYKLKQAEHIIMFINNLTNEEVRNKTIILSNE